MSLTDGFYLKTYLSGDKICLIIQNMSKEKISFVLTKDKDELDWEPQAVKSFNICSNGKQKKR